jgi:uncharacterized protein HemX
MALPSLSVLAVGGALVAGLAAWGFYERGEAIEHKAAAAVYKLAAEKNLKAFQDMQKQAAANAELSRANAEAMRQLEEFHLDRSKDILRAIELTCPNAPMDALRRRLCIERGGTDC